MKSFEQSFKVNCGLDKVWNFYTNTKHLEIITPPQLKLRIIETSNNQQVVEGLRMTLSAKLVLYTSKWHSITSLADISKHMFIDEKGKRTIQKMETCTPIFRHRKKSIACYRYH